MVINVKNTCPPPTPGTLLVADAYHNITKFLLNEIFIVILFHSIVILKGSILLHVKMSQFLFILLDSCS